LDRPTCIVYPTTSRHVQITMASIFISGSHYAVQAGAHSAMVGWNRRVTFYGVRDLLNGVGRIASATAS
jgi:hypothetical protein